MKPIYITNQDWHIDISRTVKPNCTIAIVPNKEIERLMNISSEKIQGVLDEKYWYLINNKTDD